MKANSTKVFLRPCELEEQYGKLAETPTGHLQFRLEACHHG